MIAPVINQGFPDEALVNELPLSCGVEEGRENHSTVRRGLPRETISIKADFFCKEKDRNIRTSVV